MTEVAEIAKTNPHILFYRDWTSGVEVSHVVKYAFPGGYPVYYVTADGGVLSAEAVEENLGECCDPSDSGWYVVAHDVNWEDPHLYCDHTGERIESAYAEEDSDSE